MENKDYKKIFRQLYDIYKTEDLIEAEHLQRMLREERDAIIDGIMEEYAPILATLEAIIKWLDFPNNKAEQFEKEALKNLITIFLECCKEE